MRHPLPEMFSFADDGTIPNSRLPLLVYRAGLPAGAAAMEQAFAAHGWAGGWRDGIFPFHHFHSIAHEVLGIASGEADVMFGGPAGRRLTVTAGDVIVIQAGVGHCRVSDGRGLLVIGAYPDGMTYDTCRGDPAEAARVRANIAAVPVPASDPVTGEADPLCRLWNGDR